MLEQLNRESFSLTKYQWTYSSRTCYGLVSKQNKPYSLEDTPIRPLPRSERLEQKALHYQESAERKIIMEAIAAAQKEEEQRKAAEGKKKADEERKKKEEEKKKKPKIQLRNLPPLLPMTTRCHLTSHGTKFKDRYSDMDKVRGFEYIRCAANCVNHKADLLDIGEIYLFASQNTHF
jgi:hypothetical protein